MDIIIKLTSKDEMKRSSLSKVIAVVSIAFSIFMVVGRLISGVHWITDIIGSVFLSMGLFYIYKGFVLVCLEKKKNRRLHFGI